MEDKAFRASNTVVIPSPADARERRRLIVETINAWGRTAPRWYVTAIVTYLHDITAVEHNQGAWRNKEGYCKLRLPAELFHCFRKVFNQHLPGQPPFGSDDSDIVQLYTLFPKLLPGGVRSGKGRKRKGS